jgi:hypothetical protein
VTLLWHCCLKRAIWICSWGSNIYILCLVSESSTTSLLVTSAEAVCSRPVNWCHEHRAETDVPLSNSMPPGVLKNSFVAYVTAKQRNNGDKASPRFRTVWIENKSDKHLPVRNLLQVSYNFFLFSYFYGNTDINENIIQNPSPDWNIQYLKIYKQLMHRVNIFPFLSSILRMNNMWLLDTLLWNPHWWSLRMWSTEGANLDRKYVVCSWKGWYAWIISLLRSVLSPLLYRVSQEEKT